MTTGPRALAAVQAIAAVAVLAGSLALPWLGARSLGDDPYREVDRAELVARGPLPYERVLLDLPLLAASAAAVAAAASAFRPNGRIAAAADWVLAAAGVALLACATRWLGLYLARLWDPGPSLLHLHAVPYLHLGLGVLLLPAGWRAAARLARGRSPRSANALALLGFGLAGLLATPLLPYAVHRADGFHYDEFTLASVAATGEAAARRVGWALLGLCAASGALVAVSLARLAVAARREAAHAALAWAGLAIGAAMAALSAWLIIQLRSAPAGLELGPNMLFQALALATVAVAAKGLWRRRTPDSQGHGPALG